MHIWPWELPLGEGINIGELTLCESLEFNSPCAVKDKYSIEAQFVKSPV